MYAGDRLVEFCDQQRAQALSGAANVSVVRMRSSREIARINITALKVDDTARTPSGGSSRPFYIEVLDANPHLPMLKRYNEKLGGFERW